MSDFEERQMKLRELTEELKPYRSASAPNMKPLRNEDQVQQGMKDYQELIKYKGLSTFRPSENVIRFYSSLEQLIIKEDLLIEAKTPCH